MRPLGRPGAAAPLIGVMRPQKSAASPQRHSAASAGPRICPFFGAGETPGARLKVPGARLEADKVVVHPLLALTVVGATAMPTSSRCLALADRLPLSEAIRARLCVGGSHTSCARYRFAKSAGPTLPASRAPARRRRRPFVLWSAFSAILITAIALVVLLLIVDGDGGPAPAVTAPLAETSHDGQAVGPDPGGQRAGAAAAPAAPVQDMPPSDARLDSEGATTSPEAPPAAADGGVDEPTVLEQPPTPSTQGRRAQADAQADARADAQTDGQADAQTDGQADARADARADAQADAQAEALPPKPQDGEGEDASELSAWPDVVVWRVRPGDSLAAIAREYKTTVEAIATLNGLVDADWIVVGRALRVPRGYPPPAAADALTAEELRHLRDWSDIVAWRVRPGDSLRAIAAQFDTSIAAIIQLNGIAHRDLIFVGRQLQVPLGFLPEERG